MEVKASAKFVKTSPTKVRLVVDLVRGLPVINALEQLRFNSKWASKPVIKLINSAVANAVNNFSLDKDNLFVKEIRVDEGPKFKRWMPKAHGRATEIRKRTSHIILILGEIKDSGKVEGKKDKAAKPLKNTKKPKEDAGVEIKDKEEAISVSTDEKGKVFDSRGEGRHGHAKIEGKSKKGFTTKFFQRKSG